MRAKRYAWLGGVVVLVLVCVEIVFQPILRSPSTKEINYEFRFDRPFSELAGPKTGATGEKGFEDKAQEYVDKLKLGDFLTSSRESDNVLVLAGDARTSKDAWAKGRSLEKSLAKEWPGTTWDTSKFRTAAKKLGGSPLVSLGPLAIYPMKLHVNYGLDLQGGVHLVLQCRRALFEYATPEPLADTHEERTAVVRKVRDALIRRGLADMEVAAPDDRNNILQVRTQAKTGGEFKRQERLVKETMAAFLPEAKPRKPAFYEFQRDTVDRTIEIVRTRVDKLGVSEPVIQRQGEDRIVVQLAGVYDPKEAIDYIGTTASLEFRKVPERYDPKVDDSGTVEKTYFVDKQGETVDSGAVYDEAELILNGSDLKPTSVVSVDQFQRPTVELEFNPEGKRKFANFTKRNVHKYLGIFLDRECISAPVVNEPITGGKCVISGGFEDAKEAKRLMVLLNAGALPIPIDVVENRTVTATLGADSLQKSLRAGLLGVVLVLLFMMAYYRVPGAVANVALTIYCVLVFAVLALVGATLTLPGIAGFILSVGMAVDANVIIFERLKEEMRTNKTFKSALDAGFSRAWTAILDSQVTTLIAAAVLFIYGTGPIQGFALTLSVGVLVNLFTAITVTRLLMSVVADTSLSRKRFLYLA